MTYKTYFEASPPELAANAAICLIHQTNYLLDRQLRVHEQEFLDKGGFTEKLYKSRSRRRSAERKP
jgi:four helix bundle suffix protein